jgi:protocatechuate 3,4-dioxygenase beta subunit
MKLLVTGIVIGIISMQAFPLFAKQTECVVYVVDTMGRPIQGAEVSVCEQGYSNSFSSGYDTEQRASTVQTDAAGRADLNIMFNAKKTGLFVIAQKTGFTVGWNSLFSGARIPEIRIVLDRINATAGIVTDENNQPIAGAKVTAYPIDDTLAEGARSHLRWPDSLFTTSTDHKGRFNIDCLAEWMKVSFEVEFPGSAWRTTNYNNEAQRLPRYKAGQKDIHITLYPAGQIKGRVLAKRGRTVEGIKLVARGEQIRTDKRFTSVSNADGSFTFSDLPADTYLVTTVVEENDPTQQLTVGAIAEVQAGKTVDNLKIRMRDPIQIDVLVKDAKTSQPVSNALVYFSQRRVSSIYSHLDFTTRTDSRGIAEVYTLPGKCYVYLDHDQYDSIHGEYLIKSKDTNLVTALVPHSYIAGQVVYPDRRPAEGVEVAVSTFETEQKVTDSRGRFRIRFSEQNPQRGFVIARDFKSGMAGVVDITEHTGPVKIILKPAATVTGSVTDPDGNPVKMARVVFSYAIPHYSKYVGNCLYTDQNGQYQLQAVPFAQDNFTHRVSASAMGYSLIRYKKIDIRKSNEKVVELPPLILKPCNKTLSGVAVYEDGSPAAYKAVYLNNVHTMQGQPNLHSVTDADGRFHFDGACEGWLRIQCGSVMKNDYGITSAKGGDKITLVMNNNDQSMQLYSEKDSYIGMLLPRYDILTKTIESEQLTNKKLLLCYWGIAEDGGKKAILQLSKIAEQLEQANITVILVNVRPYNKKNVSVNIGLDKKWLANNRISFPESDIPDLSDVMELRRATGARFIPHLILTDENKVIINEGFDIQWLKDNILMKESL